MLTRLNLAALNGGHSHPLRHFRVRPSRMLLHIGAGESSTVGEIVMKKMLTTIMGVSSLLFALNSYAQAELLDQRTLLLNCNFLK